MAIITLAELKTYLGITGTTEDSKLTTIVAATNTFVETYCNRAFEEAEYTEELYDGPGSSVLCLKNWPVSEVAEVIVEDTEVEERTEIDGEGYYLDAEAGILHNNDLWNRGRGIITVTYTAGYETIPDDLKFAVLELASYFRNMSGKSGIRSESLGSYSYSLMNDLSSMGGELTIPSVVIKNILDRYKSSYFADMVY